MSGQPRERSDIVRPELTAEEWLKVRKLLHEMISQISRQYRSKFDASDIVQQTLLEASHHYQDFRGKSDAELVSWLRRILSRNLLDAVRRLRAHKRSVAKETRLEASQSDAGQLIAQRLAADQTSPSIKVTRDEDSDRLLAALEKLPEDQRLAITLHHLQGWTTAEVASHMNRSTAALAGLLHRGLRSLRQQMNEAP